MQPFTKSVYIGTTHDNGLNRQIFIDIELRKRDAGRDGQTLSICGAVERISAGQCNDTIRELMEAGRIVYTKDWNKEKLAALLDIWEEHHLNDMHPECEHQEELGWRKMAGEDRTLYHWRLKSEVLSNQKRLHEEAIERASSTKTGTPGVFSAEEKRIMRLPYSLITTEPHLAGYDLKYYEKPNSGITRHEEVKHRGWLNESEHPDGILSKPCPVCGYKYGTEWKYREVPASVLLSLHEMPVAPDNVYRSTNW